MYVPSIEMYVPSVEICVPSVEMNLLNQTYMHWVYTKHVHESHATRFATLWVPSSGSLRV
jgi:hypothetical protein